MTAMTRREEFSVHLDGSPVRGRLDLPSAANDDKPLAVVLLCPGLPGLHAENDELHATITDTLVKSGLAVATLGEGSSAARRAVERVDDVAALFHGLAVRDKLDLDRLGVLGHSLGGITAACLSKRTDQINRLCLLAPVTAREVSTRLGNGSAEELATRMGGTEIPGGFFDGIDTLSPTDDVAAYDRPTLILHGAADRIVPPELSVAYHDAIKAAGHQVDRVMVALGDHFFSNPMARTACLDRLRQFFVASGNGNARR